MSSSDKNNSCGCTGGPTTATISNDPGLPALRYRIGTYATFFSRMMGQIHSPHTLANHPAGNWALASLGTRSLDDPAIALMDAWAIVADVLTFYGERIANEGFLGTATERVSALYLAQAIGYTLSPGVSAGTYLAFTVEDIIGTPTAPTLTQAVRSPSIKTQGASTYNPSVALIPQGTAVRSMPPNGGQPQTFETSADLIARPEWNILLPRLTRPADLALSSDQKLHLLGNRAGFAADSSQLFPSNLWTLSPDTPSVGFAGVPTIQVRELYVQGMNTGLATGDWILISGNNGTEDAAAAMQVWGVETLTSLNQTRLLLQPPPSSPRYSAAAGSDLSFAPVSLPAGSVPSESIAFTRDNIEACVLNVTISEADLQTLMLASAWDADELAKTVNAAMKATASSHGVFSFGMKLGFFGHNAPKWKGTTKPANLRSDPAPLDWDAANQGAGRLIWTDSQGVTNTDADVFLERTIEGIRAGDWMMISAPGSDAPVPFSVADTTQKSLADYGLSGKATGLQLKTQTGAALQGYASPFATVAGPAWIDIFTTGSDGALHHQGGMNNAWMPALENLGGTSFSQTPAAVHGGPSPVEIFLIGDDGNLWHAGWTGSFWWPPLSLGGGSVLTGSPAVVTNNGNPIPGNPLDVVAVGQDGNLYHFWFYNGTWSGPELLGKPASGWASSPCMVNRGSSYLEIFAVAGDGYIYHVGCFTGYKWWSPVAVLQAQGTIKFATTPAVSVGPTPGRTGINTTDVFAIGIDGNLYHAWYNGVVWVGTEQGGNLVYENLGGGYLVNSPCVVSNGPSPLEVFAIGNDGNLYHNWWNNGIWYGLHSLGGGNLTGSPTAVINGPNPIDVFATSLDGSLWHAWFDGNTWHTPENIGIGTLQNFPVRKSTAHVNATQLTLAEYPVTDDVLAGSLSLMLNGLVLGLKAGQAIALSGERADAPGVTADEVVLLADIVHTGGYTVLEFKSGLQFTYQRATLMLTANVVAATQGGSISAPELLGSGDATQPHQSFALKQSPLTYIAAATATGNESTLEVRVNDLLWNERQSLYGLSPSDLAYTLNQGDTGVTTVTFGDGVSGARVPAGSNNVTATYRTGLGSSGNLAAGVISILQSRPPGVRGATNPVPASGGADPETLNSAATNAPRSVLTLDRVVSLADYEHFAQAYAGVGKAQAVPLLAGSTQVVLLTLSGEGGDAVAANSQLYTTLAAALDAACDPLQQFRIVSYRPAFFNIYAGLVLDTPRYIAANVLADVKSLLNITFSFASRSLGQSVTAAEVVTAIQSVPGVIAVDLNRLFRADTPWAPYHVEATAVLQAAPASTSAATISGAELLLLNPRGITLTVNPS